MKVESQSPVDEGHNGAAGGARHREGSVKKSEEESENLNKLVSNIGMVSVQGASDPRYLGSTSGISFARVVFAAVKSSVSGTSSERGGARTASAAAKTTSATVTGAATMRDSYFGLSSKPTYKQAAFPDQNLGQKLVDLYFEHANPQIPILHRGEFMKLFEKAYRSTETHMTPRDLYMLNMVFAIGAGIIFGESDVQASSAEEKVKVKRTPSSPTLKRQKTSSLQYQPEEYHASAIVHLENILGSVNVGDRPDGAVGGLEELQAVLLLAGFALLRPVAPGLWYIVGVAVRLGVDLGLHYEDGTGIESVSADELGTVDSRKSSGNAGDDDPHRRSHFIDPKERGRRQWVRDLRRRLWWCIYSFDRLVSVCVGRPFGITDQVITTEFPSPLDDSYITPSGFQEPPSPSAPSYKRVAYHYFRLRLLQSEILQVIQHQQSTDARRTGANSTNSFMHTKLPSPFLANFDSFRSWRHDIDRRLWEWKESAPAQHETGVAFTHQFLELNYWQAMIMLYRQSLSVPTPLAAESSVDDVTSPGRIGDPGDLMDDDDVFLKVAEAGQRVLRIYRQLHRVRLVNYTFLATHHLFMAGKSVVWPV